MDGSGAARLNKRAKSYSLVAVVVLITAGLVSAAPARARQQSSGDLNVVQVRPNVYMITGAGGNIVVHLGWMGAIVVDTGSEAMTGKSLATIKKITDKPIRFIVNTDADPDHVGGNGGLAKAGLPMIGTNAFGGGAK